MTGRRGTRTARLVSKIRVPVGDPFACWEWTGFISPYGYGQMRDGQAHRVAYEEFVGVIPEGMVVDHECHNAAVTRGECEGGNTCPHRRCVNPWHLAVTSQAMNLNGGNGSYVDGSCKNGHPAEFRHRTAGGQTFCRECRRLYEVRVRKVGAARKK